MSTYLGKTLLSGVSTNVISNAHSLLDFKWSDHILNEMSWLRADTFSWHSGDVYIGAYNHLLSDCVNDYTDIQETIAGHTIWYRLAKDGHKIIFPEYESVAQQIYNATGVAWYYIIDSTNKRFKLPRTKFGFVGIRDEVGKYVEAGLPNITGSFGGSRLMMSPVTSGAFGTVSGSYGQNPSGGDTLQTAFDFDASRSNPIYGNSNTVQQKATQMYLYFYVGNYDMAHLYNIEIYNNKANIDMDNLSEDGKNIATWSSNVTNCITHIPQDIKTEIVNGVLILKAGSKLYYPDGFESDGTTPKFSTVIVPADATVTDTTSTSNDIRLAYYDITNGTIFNYLMHSSGSGDYSGGDNRVHYNLTENKLKQYALGVLQNATISFPFAVIRSNGVYVQGSIDNIFNGFGYIGSTVYALPGVKGLAPYGRTPEGNLVTNQIYNTSVVTRTFSSGINGEVLLSPNREGYPISTASPGSYNESENNYDSELIRGNAVKYGSVSCDNTGKIISLSLNTSFHSLDWNDSNTISGWGMPSDRYIDLTLGATGTSYTAPANGFIYLNKYTNAANQAIIIVVGSENNSTNNYSYKSSNPENSSRTSIVVPIKKGKQYWITYTTGGTTNVFRFYYAEGEV